MNSGKRRYNFINIAVILTTAVLFINYYRNIGVEFDCGLIHILIIVAIIFVVNAIKVGRLYLVMYGSELKFSEYLKVYCKVTPVSAVIPFKLGEFFRMYCYGKALGNVLKGIVIVLLDRFMDTAALITVIFLVWLFNGGTYIATFIFIMLVIFLVLVLVVYLVFPGVYTFWKKYFLRAKATEHRISALRMLETLNRIYEEVREISNGRGVILYFMSLVAWSVEIGGVFLQVGMQGNSALNTSISNYLAAAMGNAQSEEMRKFVFVSVIMMMFIYAVIKIVGYVQERKFSDADNYYIR